MATELGEIPLADLLKAINAGPLQEQVPELHPTEDERTPSGYDVKKMELRANEIPLRIATHIGKRVKGITLSNRLKTEEAVPVVGKTVDLLSTDNVAITAPMQFEGGGATFQVICQRWAPAIFTGGVYDSFLVLRAETEGNEPTLWHATGLYGWASTNKTVAFTTGEGTKMVVEFAGVQESSTSEPHALKRIQ